MRSLPDYGLDAPGLVRGFLIGGAAAVVASLVATNAIPPELLPRLRWLTASLRWGGAAYVVTGLMMVASSRVGKLRARDRLLDGLSLAPDARVLDVGCGRGLLLVGAARRTPRGCAVGVDVWSQKDQGANSRDATLANAAAEGVADRVEVHDDDMRALPFGDASFDAVVSSLAIHNVPARTDRRRAIDEIARVLRPGGQAAIMDIAHVDQYASDLRAAGFREVRRAGLTPWIFPPTRVLFARK
jgi:cyclopropane fatty-acyl-phospholipid synthase-like methyltransferase